VSKKSTGVAYLFWLLGFFGCLGFHRFYLGRVGSGILYLLTFGFLGVGSFIDLFLIPGIVHEHNRDAIHDLELEQLRGVALAQARRDLDRDTPSGVP
jgi:hypothetical protein